MTERRKLHGWGRTAPTTANVVPATSYDAVAHAVKQAGPRGLLARGLGRSYGDAAQNAGGLVVDMTVLDRVHSVDVDGAVVDADAGVSLDALMRQLLPFGLWLPVIPGTRQVTIGGAIAADVHGKNHHVAGSFGDHVLWIDLLGSDGSVTRCAPDAERALFDATVGGMGLTGVILRAAIRLMPVESIWIRQRTVVAPDLDAAIATFEATLDATYSVAWIDCLARGAARGRSLVYLGEHARAEDLAGEAARMPFAAPARRRLAMPLDAPSWTLNRLTVGAFNGAYFRRGARTAVETLVDWERYFYPLDAIRGWNRIYGARGFAQYQAALPLATARDALAEQLDAIAATGQGSFLAVLKRFGKGAPRRPLSFPVEGYTLALDLPLDGAALTLMDRLDEITVAAGGRVYLAKDSRMTQRTFEAGYPRAGEFAAFVARRGGGTRFASLQSLRIGL